MFPRASAYPDAYLGLMPAKPGVQSVQIAVHTVSATAGGQHEAARLDAGSALPARPDEGRLCFSRASCSPDPDLAGSGSGALE